jgi:predicted lipid-binding transport protein (Tim44 family)
VKKFLLSLCLASAATGMALAPIDVEAKRLGSGRPAGMQRQQAPTPPPGNAATPAQTPAAVPGAAAAAGTAAAAGKRSWLGPIAGLAAGLGLAALASHFGFGEALANFMMMALLAVAAVFLIGWLVRRFGNKGNQSSGLKLAGAGASSGAERSAMPMGASLWQQEGPGGTGRSGTVMPNSAGSLSGTAPAAQFAPSITLPPNINQADFERIAKMLFIRMQAANDSGQIDDLRKFTTPELFASLRMDLLERGSQAQQTDVVELNTAVVEAVRENDAWIITVRFHGRIREDGSTVEPFDELWHLVRPLDASRDWAIAGIQQRN